MLIGEIEQKTKIRLKNVVDFETNFKATDNGGYDSDDYISTSWLYNLKKLDFKKINRSQYGRGIVFKQDIVEY